MLPVVIIGADATVRDAFEPWREKDGRRVLTFDNVEEAHFALTSACTLVNATELPDIPAVALDADGRWVCTVIYGEAAFGPAVAGVPGLLQHTGWTVVAHHHLDANPGAPRRVRDGLPEGPDPSTIIWQAAVKLRAQFVIDVTGMAGSDSAPKPAVDWLAEMLMSRTYP